jgi:hypothetical protein
MGEFVFPWRQVYIKKKNNNIYDYHISEVISSWSRAGTKFKYEGQAALSSAFVEIFCHFLDRQEKNRIASNLVFYWIPPLTQVAMALGYLDPFPRCLSRELSSWLLVNLVPQTHSDLISPEPRYSLWSEFHVHPSIALCLYFWFSPRIQVWSLHYINQQSTVTLRHFFLRLLKWERSSITSKKGNSVSRPTP